METDPVVGLALQLGVTEAIPLLEDEHLHHHHGVIVGSASLGGLVGVEALDDWCELVPIYEWFDLCEFVSEFLDFFVGFSEEVRVKRVHNIWCSF